MGIYVHHLYHRWPEVIMKHPPPLTLLRSLGAQEAPCGAGGVAGGHGGPEALGGVLGASEASPGAQGEDGRSIRCHDLSWVFMGKIRSRYG